MTRDGRQNDTPLLLGKYYFSTGTNSHLFCPQMDHFLHRCQHDSFYTHRNTLKGVDHPCSDLGGGADIRSGGQLARFAAKWTGAPPLPATTVRRGFHWSWVADPLPLCLPSTTQHQPALRDPILDWVRKGVVIPVPPQPCFLSHLFAVPRPDNRPLRLIIDLSRLNQYIFSPHSLWTTTQSWHAS